MVLQLFGLTPTPGRTLALPAGLTGQDRLPSLDAEQLLGNNSSWLKKHGVTLADLKRARVHPDGRLFIPDAQPQKQAGAVRPKPRPPGLRDALRDAQPVQAPPTRPRARPKQGQDMPNAPIPPDRRRAAGLLNDLADVALSQAGEAPAASPEAAVVAGLTSLLDQKGQVPAPGWDGPAPPQGAHGAPTRNVAPGPSLLSRLREFFQGGERQAIDDKRAAHGQMLADRAAAQEGSAIAPQAQTSVSDLLGKLSEEAFAFADTVNPNSSGAPRTAPAAPSAPAAPGAPPAPPQSMAIPQPLLNTLLSPDTAAADKKSALASYLQNLSQTNPQGYTTMMQMLGRLGITNVGELVTNPEQYVQAGDMPPAGFELMGIGGGRSLY